MLARALVAPQGAVAARRAAAGRRSTALQLLLGTLALFVLAGFIEGTISQIHPPRLSVAFKVGFALMVGNGVYAYLVSAAGRHDAVSWLQFGVLFNSAIGLGLAVTIWPGAFTLPVVAVVVLAAAGLMALLADLVRRVDGARSAVPGA